MKPEVRSILNSFIPGILFVCLLSSIKLYEELNHISLVSYGLLPRSISDLSGILTFPLIHKDYEHLFSNSIPLVILMALLRYFYKEMSFKVFTLIWIIGGLWLWLGGRPAYHIGASGLVYGLSSFIFFSGLWRKERKTMAVSLIVVFLYGGMVWGLFPFFKETSWEGHLFGGTAGLLLSWVYRKEGPQRVKYQWEDEPDEFDDLPMRETGLTMEQFEDVEMNESPITGDRFDEKNKEGRFENLPEEETLKEGDEKIEDEVSLNKSEKECGIDLFDLSLPNITYEYIEPKKDGNGNRADRQAGADDTGLKDSDKK